MDNLAVVTTAKTVEEQNRTARRVARWLTDNGLEVTSQKTETVILAGRKRARSTTFEVTG